MFVTVRQLEDLHKQNGANGHVTLPYRARLTPLASDWVRAKKVVLGYSDGETKEPAIPPGEFSGRAQHAGFGHTRGAALKGAADGGQARPLNRSPRPVPLRHLIVPPCAE
jgi:hypothetical protein